MRQGRKSRERGAWSRELGAKLCVAAVLALVPVRGGAAAEPDPQELLKVARMASTQQEVFDPVRLNALRGHDRAGVRRLATQGSSLPRISRYERLRGRDELSGVNVSMRICLSIHWPSMR